MVCGIFWSVASKTMCQFQFDGKRLSIEFVLSGLNLLVRGSAIERQKTYISAEFYGKATGSL